MRWLISCLILSFVFGGACIAQEAGTLIEDAEALFDRWNGAFDFTAYRQRLEDAIDLYEQALALLPEESLPSRSIVLNRLARAYFELGTAYLEGEAAKEPAFAAGKDHALAGLRLDPIFVETETDSFREALATASNLEAIFWYGTNLGSYLNYHQIEAIVYGGMRDIPVCYERAIELDQSYADVHCLLAEAWLAVGTGPEATAVIDEKEKKVYPVLSGLVEGELVVTKANFLIDSQSQLSGVASSAYGGAIGAEEETKGSPKGSSGHQH